MDNTVINTISLFSGVGMLDEGLHAGLGFLGIRSRTVMYAERDAYPVSVLEARMEEGSLPPAPVWFGDLCELDASQFRGVVDCIVAGFPCQDLSLAGRRAGLDGARSGLFYQVIRIANEANAKFLYLENVSGLYSADGYSARCVCGWDHRWGGIDQHTKAWRGSGGCGNVGEGDTDPELAIQNIRRQRQANRLGDGEMASTVLLDDHDRSGDLFSRSDSPVHDHQKGNCDRNTKSGFGGQRPVARQAQAVDSSEVSGVRGSKECCTESEQEGSATGSRGLDCPSCGEPLGEQAGELVNGAFRDILWELAANGFHAEWTCLPASDIGASHGRARWFCWAWRAVGDTKGIRQVWPSNEQRWSSPPRCASKQVDSPGRMQRRTGHEQDRPGGTEAGEHEAHDRAANGSAELGHTTGTRPQEPGQARERELPAQVATGIHHRSEQPDGSMGIFAPGPADPAWPGIIQQWPHLAPALEPSFRSMADGLAYDMDDCRPQRIKCCGNGVVAAQAAFALVGLVRRMRK